MGVGDGHFASAYLHRHQPLSASPSVLPCHRFNLNSSIPEDSKRILPVQSPW